MIATRRAFLVGGIGALGAALSLMACGATTATVASSSSSSDSAAPSSIASSVATSTTAASSTSAAASPAAAPSVFSVFLPATGTLAAGWKILQPRFDAANPGIKLDVSPTVDVTKLQAIIAAGTAPDLTHFDRYQVTTWAVKGLFQPVDDLLRPLDPEATFLAPTLKEATYQNKRYAMPQDTGIRGLFWNVAQLQQAGLDAQQGPRSFDDLDRYTQALTKQEGDSGTQQTLLAQYADCWGK